MAIRIPDALRDELASMNLVLWVAHHPLVFDYVVGGKPGRGKEDKTRVEVQLSGPGLGDHSPWGFGPTLRAAVDDALSRSSVVDRVKGLKGALMRLSLAITDCNRIVMHERLAIGHPEYGDPRDPDWVPF